MQPQQVLVELSKLLHIITSIHLPKKMTSPRYDQAVQRSSHLQPSPSQSQAKCLQSSESLLPPDRWIVRPIFRKTSPRWKLFSQFLESHGLAFIVSNELILDPLHLEAEPEVGPAVSGLLHNHFLVAKVQELVVLVHVILPHHQILISEVLFPKLVGWLCVWCWFHSLTLPPPQTSCSYLIRQHLEEPWQQGPLCYHYTGEDPQSEIWRWEKLSWLGFSSLIHGGWTMGLSLNQLCQYCLLQSFQE